MDNPGYAATYSPLVSVLMNKVTEQGVRLVALSGAQGCGKTTLAANLQQAFAQSGVHAGIVSLDDYYLTKRERQRLANTIHPLLRSRGVPGTHHIARLRHDLESQLAGHAIALPRFDKANDDISVDLPAKQYDLLIVEGWCLGAVSQTAEQLATPVNELDALPDAAIWRSYQNEQLRDSYQPLWALFPVAFFLRAPDWQTICRWRQQQEHTLWRERGQGMDESALQQFMLPFQRWTQAMLQGALWPGMQQLTLDATRRVTNLARYS